MSKIYCANNYYLESFLVSESEQTIGMRASMLDPFENEYLELKINTKIDIMPGQPYTVYYSEYPLGNPVLLAAFTTYDI